MVAPLAGEPFVLEKWQEAVIGNLFGWKRDEDGTLVRLADIATTELGAEDYDSTSWYKGKPAIFVGMKQAPGANPLDVAKRVREAIDIFLLGKGYTNPPSIVAGGPEGGDCHNSGTGDLRTGEPVIIDIFPRNRETLYNGDCTRTVVHGEIPGQIAKMHAVVV